MPGIPLSMMMASAALLFLAALQAESQGRGHTRSWLALAAAFAYLSLDEATGIHEVFIEPLRGAFGLSGIFYWAWVLPALVLVGGFGLAMVPFLLSLPRRGAALFIASGALFVRGAFGLSGIFYWAWVLPALVLVGGFGLAMVPFLLSLPRRGAALFIASGALFVGGALGLEMASGYVITARGEEAPLVALLAICEETLEMLGLALFTGALCDHLARQNEGAPVLAFSEPAAGSPTPRHPPVPQAS